MNPFLIIAALLILYSLKNYKQGFFLFLAFRLFLNNNINLINLPGVPLLTLEVFMSIFFALLYVIKRKRYSRVITTSPLPFNKVFIWALLSYVVSSFISIAGIQNTFTSLLSVVFCDFISAYLCWMLISSKEDILKVVNILLGASLIICTYAFIEKFLGYNPVMDYEIDLAGPRATDWQYLEDERGTRVQSFFLHPIGGSINFGLIFCLCLYGYVYYKAYFSKLQQKTMLLVGIMAFIASLLSNSRTPLVFLAVGILPLINLKNKQSVRILAFAVISIIVLMPYLDFVENLIVSVLNPEKTEIRGRLYSYVEKPHMGIRTESDTVLSGSHIGRPASGTGKYLDMDYGRTGNIGNYHILYLYFYFMPIGLALAGKMPVLSPAGFHSGVDRIFNTGNAPLSFLSGLHSDL